MSWVKYQLNTYILPGLCQSQSRILSELHMLCTASSHFVFDLCRRPFYGCARTQRDAGYQTTNPYVHRPVVVKRAVIGSKGGWKLSTIFLSCKVLHDWSIIKVRKYIVFLRRVYLCWGVSQNVPSQTPPNWSKRQHTKTKLVKRPHKTSPF